MHTTNLTLQEMFDRTIQHLLDQGERAMGEKTTLSTGREIQFCAYKAEDGKTCAVGFWLTDLPEIANVVAGVGDLIDRHGDPVSDRLRPIDYKTSLGVGGWSLRNFWAEMQSLHDQKHNWFPDGGVHPYFWEEASAIAAEWGLNLDKWQEQIGELRAFT